MKQLSTELKNEAVKHVQKYLNMAHDLYFDGSCGELFVSVSFDLKGTTSGRAYMSEKCHIQFNPILLAENPEYFETNTIPHEVAHIVAHHYFGTQKQAHGRRWKSIMVQFGASPNRCHNLDVSNSISRNTKKYEVKCGCANTSYVGAKIAKKLQNGHVYECRACTNSITLTGYVTDMRSLLENAA